MNIIRYKTALALGTALIASVAAMPAYAQDTTEAVASVPEDDGEILVTARRREESLQDVPVAITAYSGAALEKAGALDITAISDTTPNVTLEPSRGTNSTLTAFIRGVGQQDPVAGFESGVGIYLDDVYLNRPQAAVLDIYDVERIEVLRGPQGTLYGRNTIGGAIKYVTKRLPADPQMKVRANLGTYNQADLIVSASTPLSDSVRIGLSGARLSRGGFGDNLNNNGLENYNRDILATRGTIEFTGGDNVFIRISGDYTNDHSDPRNGHRLITSLLTKTPVLDDVYDTQAGLTKPKQDIEAYGGAVHAEFKLGGGLTLKNIFAYRKDRSYAPIDFDSLPAADVDVPAIYTNDQLSNELQLAYASDKLNGMVGFYYLDANAQNTFDVVLGTTGAALGLPGFAAHTYGDVNTKTWAVFGDFTYDFTEQLSLSVGGRYTVDKRDAVVIRSNVLNGPVPELGGNGVQLGALTSDFHGKKTFKEFTPRVSLAFKPTDDHMVYATWSKGFKGGGFDPRGLSTAAPDLNGDGTRSAEEIFDYFLFEPEKVTSYELGYKADLFDRRLRFAIAGFYADYKDVQVPGSVGAVVNNIPTFVGVTTNAGKADFKGVETEFTANLARDFAGDGSRINLSGTVGYLDAKYKEFVTNVPGRGPVDVAEFRRIQNTPKWTTSATLDMTVPAGDGSLYAATTFSYRSKTYQFETPSPFLDQKGYGLWDASLVWSSDNDRWTVGLHGKNLANKHYKTSGYQFLSVDPVTGVPLRNAAGNVIPSLGLEGTVTAFYGNPRQVFLSLGLKL
ncbi:TonB-dependent receptor [Pseudonocardia sp. TMWB2A]|uniref:TonB-dependent receptor n=1 Tax=Pseudonocardia sp. TMWB2A TaxID=687430 RepID=UPI00307EDD73